MKNKPIYRLAALRFLILLLVMVFALDVPWGEAALYSAVLAAIGIGVLVWKEHVW